MLVVNFEKSIAKINIKLVIVIHFFFSYTRKGKTRKKKLATWVCSPRGVSHEKQASLGY